MYLLVKFGGRRSYGNGDINFYMNTLEKAELTALERHVERFPKLGIPIYNSEVAGTAGKKMGRRRRRRTNALSKGYGFHANAMKRFFFCVIPVIYKLIRMLLFVRTSTGTNFNNYICLQFCDFFSCI